MLPLAPGEMGNLAGSCPCGRRTNARPLTGCQVPRRSGEWHPSRPRMQPEHIESLAPELQLREMRRGESREEAGRRGCLQSSCCLLGTWEPPARFFPAASRDVFILLACRAQPAVGAPQARVAPPGLRPGRGWCPAKPCEQRAPGHNSFVRVQVSPTVETAESSGAGRDMQGHIQPKTGSAPFKPAQINPVCDLGAT